MRKILFALLMLVCLLLPAAALADSFTFPEQGAACVIPSGKYTFITSDNVAEKTAWLAEQNKTADEVQADFA